MDVNDGEVLDTDGKDCAELLSGWADDAAEAAGESEASLVVGLAGVEVGAVNPSGVLVRRNWVEMRPPVESTSICCTYESVWTTVTTLLTCSTVVATPACLAFSPRWACFK